MRIIAGKFGGRNIKSSNTDRIHPMGERIRNAIFNKIGGSVVDATVADVFAGTGAIGIEALSRGAKSCVFVEKNRQIARMLAENLEMLGVDNGRLVQATALQFTETNQQKFDLVFADPPYHDLQNSSVQALAGIVKTGGMLVLSNPKSAPTPEIPELTPEDERTYADAKIIFYKKELK